MFPESDLIKTSYTIRGMAWLGDSGLTRRSLIRWFALSVGLLNPGDRRETVVDVLDLLFRMNISNGKPLTIADLTGSGIPEKTAYYHMKKLKDMGLVEHRGGGYVLVRDFQGNPSMDRFLSNINQALEQSKSAFQEISRFYRKGAF